MGAAEKVTPRWAVDRRESGRGEQSFREVRQTIEDATGMALVRSDDKALVLHGRSLDVVLRFAGAGRRLRVTWEVAAREAPPGLGTWWAGWDSEHESEHALADVVDRLRSTVTRVNRVLEDNGVR